MNRFWKPISAFFGKGTPEGSFPSNSGKARADALLSGLVREGRLPGLAIRVLFRGSEWFSGGYGFADLGARTPVVPGETVFRTASISKPITATALARMVALGRIGLDEDVRTYVPEFPMRHGPVTLRQLASHTAGIRAYRGKEFALNRPLTIADSLPLFAEDPLEYPPGEGYGYNSFGFVLLSLAMERAWGAPFPHLVETLVLEPFGMGRTSMETPGEPRPGQATFYSRQGKGFREATAVDTRYKLAGGGYLSTVADVCRLGQAYQEGTVAPSSVLQPFLTSLRVGGEPTWYGLGWQVSQDPSGRPFFGHVGNAVGVYSNFFVYPDSGLVVCILINCSDPGVQPVLDRVIALLHPGPGSESS